MNRARGAKHIVHDGCVIIAIAYGDRGDLTAWLRCSYAYADIGVHRCVCVHSAHDAISIRGNTHGAKQIEERIWLWARQGGIEHGTWQSMND